MPHIYWANFFSREYVTQLGREKIETAPAWLTEDLGDGGLLYVLSSSPGYHQEGHVAKDAVQKHLGVESVR